MPIYCCKYYDGLNRWEVEEIPSHQFPEWYVWTGKDNHHHVFAVDVKAKDYMEAIDKATISIINLMNDEIKDREKIKTNIVSNIKSITVGPKAIGWKYI